MNGTRTSRFWAKVNKTETCWVWIGARASYGYGSLRSGGHKGRLEKAHRISWEIHFGPIPDGLLVLHHCDNPPCVRPDHLFLGTQSDNMYDAVRKGRHVRPLGDLRHHIPRGEQLGSITKLTADDVREIRKRASDGETQGSIAKDFPASRQQIGQIILRKGWSHIE